MKHLTRALILTGLLGAGCPSQAPAAKPDPDVAVELKRLKKLISDRKGAKDAEAVKLIENLDLKFEKMHPGDKRQYVDQLGYILRRINRKPLAPQIYRISIRALGRAGKPGAQQLAKNFGIKARFKGKDWIDLRGLMLEQIGLTRDPRQIDLLLRVALRSPHDKLMAKAGGALRHYAAETLVVRKEICKDLIRKFVEIENNSKANIDTGDPNVHTAKQTHRAVAGLWNTTLQKLTRQKLDTASAWMNFRTKNKKKNWDKPPKKSRKKTPR